MFQAKRLNMLASRTEETGKNLGKILLEAAKAVSDGHGLDSGAIEKCQAFLDQIRRNNDNHTRVVDMMENLAH